MKKQIIIGLFLLSTATFAFGAAQKQAKSLAQDEDAQNQLIDQLTIKKIQMDTFVDLGQLDRLLQEARDIVNTFEATTAQASRYPAQYKTLIGNINEARKIMNKIMSIHRRRAIPMVAAPKL